MTMQAITAAPRSQQWMMLSEISQQLGIHYDTVRHTVRKASTCGEEWVKRAPYPLPSSPVRWLVDTEHPGYKCVEQRWRKYVERMHAAANVASLSDEIAGQEQEALCWEQFQPQSTDEQEWTFAPGPLWSDQDDPLNVSHEEGAELATFTPPTGARVDRPTVLSSICTCQNWNFDLIKAWPEFCQELSNQGLIVYADALAQDRLWQWSWDGAADSGYPDATDAIIGAIQYHYFSYGEQATSKEMPACTSAGSRKLLCKGGELLQ